MKGLFCFCPSLTHSHAVWFSCEWASKRTDTKSATVTCLEISAYLSKRLNKVWFIQLILTDTWKSRSSIDDSHEVVTAVLTHLLKTLSFGIWQERESILLTLSYFSKCLYLSVSRVFALKVCLLLSCQNYDYFNIQIKMVLLIMLLTGLFWDSSIKFKVRRALLVQKLPTQMPIEIRISVISVFYVPRWILFSFCSLWYLEVAFSSVYGS